MDKSEFDAQIEIESNHFVIRPVGSKQGKDEVISGIIS